MDRKRVQKASEVYFHETQIFRSSPAFPPGLALRLIPQWSPPSCLVYGWGVCFHAGSQSSNRVSFMTSCLVLRSCSRRSDKDFKLEQMSDFPDGQINCCHPIFPEILRTFSPTGGVCNNHDVCEDSTCGWNTEELGPKLQVFVSLWSHLVSSRQIILLNLQKKRCNYKIIRCIISWPSQRDESWTRVQTVTQAFCLFLQH